ncbi:LuxR C-terminal-related transcriptional regulator [Bacillus sp. 03113]|uniref:LuxR C-terminal-related transcriptional regulator n=1 Tax=Bacillus sp. 03113 TaxID=2578211 RepID=UPI001C65726C|nr:LuxR C-terminal-related transcriptional regulator [Bacillus sp. 03113]
MIPEEMKPALMGVLPATLITCSQNGIPNITNISRVWYVDRNHVAIANHMLKKSIQNLKENPFAFIRTVDPNTFSTWELEVEYTVTRTDGEIFEEMKKQYELLTMMLETGITMTVHSSEMFRVLSARICSEENSLIVSMINVYNELLEQLEKKFGWACSALWLVEENESNLLQLAAVRGIDEETAKQVLYRVALWSVQKGKPVRISNIRSQFQYAMTTFLHHQKNKEDFSKQDYEKVDPHYIVIPILGDSGKITGAICSQSNDSACFSAFNDYMLQVTSRHLSELIKKISLLEKKERQPIIEQALERIQLEGSKKSGEVKSPLSPRELQVAILIARGLSNAEIADTLFLSKRTVTTHLERIYQKLEINSRTALASYIIEHGLLDPKNNV